MKKNDASINLYQEYLKTHNIQCIHEIIANNEHIIRLAITNFINKMDSIIREEELYSLVYEELFNRLTQNRELGFKTQSQLGIYLRQSVFKILDKEYRKEQEIERIIKYEGLLNEDIKETQHLSNLEDTLEDMIIEKYEHEVLEESIKTLSENAQKIMHMYLGHYGRKYSYSEIAKIMKVSRSRVQQIITASEERIILKAKAYKRIHPSFKVESPNKIK